MGSQSDDSSSSSSESAASPDYYMQVAIYAAGHALALLVGAGLYGAWAIIMPFQEPLLWALLCSIALRDVKSWLVHVLRCELTARSIPSCMLRLSCLPLLLLIDAVKDVNTHMRCQLSTLNHLARTLTLSGSQDEDNRKPDLPSCSSDSLNQVFLQQKEQEHCTKQQLQQEQEQQGGFSRMSSNISSKVSGSGIMPSSYPVLGGGEAESQVPAGTSATGEVQAGSKQAHLIGRWIWRVQQMMYCIYCYGYALLYMVCMSFRPVREFFNFKEINSLPPPPPSHSVSFNHVKSKRAFTRSPSQSSNRGGGKESDGMMLPPPPLFFEIKKHGQSSGTAQEGSHARKHSHKGPTLHVSGGSEEESPSTPLFRWLLRAMLARQAWVWGVAWGPTAVLTIAAVLVALIALANRLSSASSALLGRLASLEAGSHIKSGIQRTITRRRPVNFKPLEKKTSPSIWSGLFQGIPKVASYLGTSVILAAHRALLRAVRYIKHMDAYMRHKLMDNLDTLVSVALVLGLILGTLLLTAVLCVQIGIEGRRAVVSADRSVRRHSTAMASAAAAAVSPTYPALDGPQMNVTKPSSPAPGHPLESVVLSVSQHRQGLMDTAVALQQYALKAVQIMLPTLQKHADSLVNHMVQRYNLTNIIQDMEKVYYSLPISLNCTKEQMGAFSEDVAASALRLQPLEAAADSYAQQVAASKTKLKQVMEQWERRWLASQAPSNHTSSDASSKQVESPDANADERQCFPLLDSQSTQCPDNANLIISPPTGFQADSAESSLGQQRSQLKQREESQDHETDGVGQEGEGGPEEQQQVGQGGKNDSAEAESPFVAFSNKDWVQGKAHAKLLDVRRALATARAASKEAAASVSAARADYKLAVRKLRSCHGLNAADRNVLSGQSGGSGEFLDNLLGGSKGGAVQLGSLVTRITRTWEHLSQGELSLMQEELSALKQELMAMLNARTSNARGSVHKGPSSSLHTNRTAPWVDKHPYLQYLPGPARCLIHWLPGAAKRFVTRATSVLAAEDASAAPTAKGGDGEEHGGQAVGGVDGEGTHALCEEEGEGDVCATEMSSEVINAEGGAQQPVSWFQSLSQLWSKQGGEQDQGVGSESGHGEVAGSGDDTSLEGGVVEDAEGAAAGGSEGHGNLFRALSGLAVSVGSATAGMAVSLFGGTTSLALDTTTGMIRMGMFLFEFALDLLLFVATTIALLASTTDPLQRLLHMLPIGTRNQDLASRALSNAMRGVFASSLKLAAFHAGFTWLTLQACGTHLTHLLTLVSMLVSVLPLLPCWVAVLPPAFELAMSSPSNSGWLWAAGLIAAHVAAQSYADDIILGEIDSSISYLTGLAVGGGMALWPSAPLKGVLLGPMALAMLSVAANLHSQLVNETEANAKRDENTSNDHARFFRRESGSCRHSTGTPPPWEKPKDKTALVRGVLSGLPPLPDKQPATDVLEE